MVPTLPPIEVHHADRSTTVVAHMPRVNPQSLRVAFERERVVIEAEATDGRCHLEVPLAARIDDRRTEMRFADGVLWLFMPNVEIAP